MCLRYKLKTIEDVHSFCDMHNLMYPDAADLSVALGNESVEPVVESPPAQEEHEDVQETKATFDYDKYVAKNVKAKSKTKSKD